MLLFTVTNASVSVSKCRREVSLVAAEKASLHLYHCQLLLLRGLDNLWRLKLELVAVDGSNWGEEGLDLFRR
jgi:hypothetical protein